MYQLNIIKKIKKDCKKKLVKDSKTFLKKKKKKANNMVVNVAKISKNMKKINWLSIEKNILKRESIIYRRVFYFRKFCFFILESIRNCFLLRLCLKSSLSTNKKCKIFDFQTLEVLPEKKIFKLPFPEI